jgi:2-aminoethylphosphonate transport system permease protein
MLLHSAPARFVVRLIMGILVIVLIGAPVLVTVLAAFAGSWNGVWPTDPTGKHLQDALASDNLASILVSLQTAVLASLSAVIVGTWAALAGAAAPARVRAVTDAVFHLPAAVPSVVIGLGLLTAFSQKPFLLNGTVVIVVLAQTLLVLSFAYNTVSVAVRTADPMMAGIAGSLGASPLRVLLTVRLPLLLPAIAASAGLALALCMGELGATVMVYPASWRTLPVTIFALSDRGNIFLAAADTLVLISVTLVALSVIARVRGRTEVR